MLQRALADGGVVWRAMSHKVAVVSDRKPLCRPRQIVQVFHGADTACCVKYSYATKNYESPFLNSLGATLEYLTKAKPSAGLWPMAPEWEKCLEGCRRRSIVKPVRLCDRV